MTGTRAPRTDGLANRQRILSAAREAFTELGFDAPMADIARRAGLAVGTMYRHFPSKESLGAELLRQRYQAMTAQALAPRHAASRTEALRLALLANAELLWSDRASLHLLAHQPPAVHAEVEPQRQALEGAYMGLIDAASIEGRLRPDLTAPDIALLMTGVCAVMDSDRDGSAWRRVLDLLWSGLGPAPPHR